MEFDQPIGELEKRVAELRGLANASGDGTQAAELEETIQALEGRIDRLRRSAYDNLDPWERTQLSRHPQRPYTLDYLQALFTDFVELHGDRTFMDEPAMISGLARFRGTPCIVMGHQKGRNTRENLHRNFGMARPEGYRKAMRLFELAERFRRPIFTFIDTPGAYPGIASEERGQAEAIAHAILDMARLTVPTIVTVIGEGGSGGALAIGVGNRVLMMENSIYSVISPEACAAILWRDGSQGPKAARALRYTAQDCLSLDVADEVVPEPLGGAHLDPPQVMELLGDALERHLKELSALSPEEVREDRYQRVRKLGRFTEMPV